MSVTGSRAVLRVGRPGPVVPPRARVLAWFTGLPSTVMAVVLSFAAEDVVTLITLSYGIRAVADALRFTAPDLWRIMWWMHFPTAPPPMLPPMLMDGGVALADVGEARCTHWRVAFARQWNAAVTDRRTAALVQFGLHAAAPTAIVNAVADPPAHKVAARLAAAGQRAASKAPTLALDQLGLVFDLAHMPASTSGRSASHDLGHASVPQWHPWTLDGSQRYDHDASKDFNARRRTPPSTVVSAPSMLSTGASGPRGSRPAPAVVSRHPTTASSAGSLPPPGRAAGGNFSGGRGPLTATHSHSESASMVATTSPPTVARCLAAKLLPKGVHVLDDSVCIKFMPVAEVCHQCGAITIDGWRFVIIVLNGRSRFITSWVLALILIGVVVFCPW
jgi:hypothetical protein